MNKPTPQVFPTAGPQSMAFVAYDANRFDVCADAECKCRTAKGNTRGYGATEQEALEAFWEGWREA